jgi:hypothetical protein
MKNDDDMPPELEDFTEELSKIRLNKSNNNQESSEIKVNVIENNNIEQRPKIIQKTEQKEEEFGSFMKKGFFKKASNSKGNTKINENNKVDDLTHIKAKEQGKVSQTFQDNLKNDMKKNMENVNSKKLLENIVNKKDEWMNQDLLTKIAQKPELMKYFMDPRFTEVINLFQKNPQQAIQQYGHVKEFSQFIKDFSSIMADHFNGLSHKQQQQDTVQQFDKETQEILNDPEISKIIYKLQTEGKLDIEEINKDLVLSAKVKKLIDKGVFQVQKESELNKNKK